jgi:hypothetical protein
VDAEAVNNREMAESWEWDQTLYAQSAAYYVEGRLAYPQRLGVQIACAPEWAASHAPWMSAVAPAR